MTQQMIKLFRLGCCRPEGRGDALCYAHCPEAVFHLARWTARLQITHILGAMRGIDRIDATRPQLLRCVYVFLASARRQCQWSATLAAFDMGVPFEYSLFVYCEPVSVGGNASKDKGCSDVVVDIVRMIQNFLQSAVP